MLKDNLYQYLLELYPEKKQFFDLIKYNLNSQIYYFGDHFKKPVSYSFYSKTNFIFNSFLAGAYIYFTNLILPKKNGKKGLSSAYYNSDYELIKLGFVVERTAHAAKKKMNTGCSIKLFIITKKIQWAFLFKDYKYLISDDFFILVNEFLNLIDSFVKEKQYEFLLTPNDLDFFSRAYIWAFKKLNKPTFILAHGGLHSLYDGKIDNFADYVALWGKKEVDAYIQMGYDKEKFFVSGHPFYAKKPEKLKFSFENILVLTKSLNGVCPLENPHLEDRGNAIMYLLSIEKVLKGLGINNVRLRPHPSENYKWYEKYINTEFFRFDTEPLTISLQKATLVIGPTSTVFIDSIAHGINYLIYEPVINGKTLMGYSITPPMDDTDKRLPIARNEDELKHFLEQKKLLDLSVYEEFAAPEYDLSFIKDLVSK